MQQSRLPYFFLAMAAVLAVVAVLLLIFRPGVDPDRLPGAGMDRPLDAAIAEEKSAAALAAAALSAPDPAIEDALGGIASGISAVNPEELVTRFAKALESGDLDVLNRLVGGGAGKPDVVAKLAALADLPLRLRKIDEMREVGELELNTRSRWALRLKGAEPGRASITLDLARKDGAWRIEGITLPSATGELLPAADADPLEVADAFIQALLVQQFEFARNLVDASGVSDAKLAGLCILFEEGGYRMRRNKPLRTMFRRDDTAGFLVNVEAVYSQDTAQFALTLRRPSAGAGWLVSEINLDQLLVEYSRRMAGGDIYYSPLVKSPAGGDTLALYFAFDEAEMNARTRRQLEIVSLILRSDPGKRITLSGHTDALGTDDYNRELSARRADVVQGFLIQSGVEPSQIVSLAKGASQPRRPNLTETGQDNPEGRRANRRTEIYLDF
jgi:outer membrane protein OmpA-like peptidoglycan-associated protein